MPGFQSVIMNYFKALLYIFGLLITSSESAKILGLFTSPSPSHVIIHMSVAKALVNQGHDLTIVTTLPLKDKNPKYKHILLAPADEEIKTFEDGMSGMTNSENPIKKLKLHIGTIAYMTNMQYNALRRTEFQELLRTEKFDLLIFGYFFNDFQLAVAAQLNIPVVFSWLVGPMGMTNSYSGNPNEMSYVPNVMVGDKQPLDFRGRVVTFLANSMFYGLEKFGNYKYEQYYE